MERSMELAHKAFDIIVEGTKGDEPMDGDETVALVDELKHLLDMYFANA